MTTEGDLVLVHIENEPAFFARIELISPDAKPQWFHVKMLVLQVPVVVITWILREPYINGEEFTMGGRPMRLDKVVVPEESSAEPDHQVSPKDEEEPLQPKQSVRVEKNGERGKIVSLQDRRKKPSKP
jgi:hypothetical protein